MFFFKSTLLRGTELVKTPYKETIYNTEQKIKISNVSKAHKNWLKHLNIPSEKWGEDTNRRNTKQTNKMWPKHTGESETEFFLPESENIWRG